MSSEQISPPDEMEELLQTITADYKLSSEQLSTPGRQFYALIAHLAAGEMGQIDLVKESALQRKVAMKMVRQQEKPARIRRFLLEAQITAQLDHPHIVPVYSLENTQAGLAYTMKRVQGQTFRELIDASQSQAMPVMPLTQRLEVFLAVCDALEYAHSRGVIHRELEPNNLMIGHFHEVYVMDWGLARVLPDSPLEVRIPPELAQDHEEDSPLEGNLCYFSPEQAKGQWAELDQRSDLYVLGLILYEWICLRPARTGDSYLALLQMAEQGWVNPPALPGAQKLPSELTAILHKATALKPEQRYASASALADDLRRYLKGESVSAQRDTLLQSTSRLLVRHQLLALGTVLTLVLLCSLLGLWSLWSQQRELARLRAREQALNRYLGAVYAQSRLMNRQFLKAEMQLEALSAVAVSHLTQQNPVRDRYYLHKKFNPPDQVASQQYHSQLSVNWPLSVKTWSLPESQVAKELGSLSSLRHFQKRLLIESKTPERLSPLEKQTLIAQSGTPVSYATLVLKQGAGAWLPGGDFESQNYDPVIRPFYKFGAYQHARRWGNPYIDVSGAGLLLIAATGLFDHQNQFLGTASLDVKFDTIIQTMLALPPALRTLKGGYLLDDQGRIAIRSNQKGQQFSATIHPDLKLPDYPHPAVVKAIKAQQSGHQILPGKQPLLVAYYRIPALGWYYLVESDLEKALLNEFTQQKNEFN
ncbi:MAG: protein kinase [Candidatus Sericytochromatia bacterium]|nr:protein kinase [Candidatus Sericytochromatia bacterium]